MRVSPVARRRALGLILVAGTILTAGGCGSQTGTVTGKVLYNGSPLKGGNVTFLGGDGKTGTSTIEENGTYTIKDMMIGQVKIAVETKSLARSAATPINSPPPDKELKGPPPPNPEEALRRYVEIPGNYADAKTSGLTYTVKAGQQPYDIELK